jgi:SEC-C motif-containing protein
MRSRYAAYVRGEEGYLLATWHPRTRPASLTLGDGPVWEGLEVLATRDGQAEDDRGVVEFRAVYREGGSPGVLHEVSRFVRRGGRWVYVDGDVS